MGDSVPSKLSIHEGLPRNNPVVVSQSPPPCAQHPDQFYAEESFGPNHARPADGIEPFSLQWFLDVERARHCRHGRWMANTLEFNRHAGETLLALGTGLGTDWVQYAREGSSVIVSCSSAEQLALVRRNFELRQLAARFVHSMPTSLPIEGSSIDVVCLNDLLHRVSDPGQLIEEVYRVLKPGGKVIAVTPARYNIEFWRRVLLPWGLWYSRRTPAITYTARSLKTMFHRFSEHRVHKRHLRRADVPHLWRLVPTPMLERMVGRLLVLKAFKPLSSAMHLPLAA